MRGGMIILALTGPRGSGKTTLAEAIKFVAASEMGVTAEIFPLSMKARKETFKLLGCEYNEHYYETFKDHPHQSLGGLTIRQHMISNWTSLAGIKEVCATIEMKQLELSIIPDLGTTDEAAYLKEYFGRINIALIRLGPLIWSDDFSGREVIDANYWLEFRIQEHFDPVETAREVLLKLGFC